jgi:pimeloyl-ACP methyl ester carboxylesterase
MDQENHGNSTVYPDPSKPRTLEQAAKDPIDPNSEAAILAAAASTLAHKERQMTYDTRLTHAIWDLATSGANPAVDLLVCLERRHTIGFRYVDITRAVAIHHGSKDTRVPVENVRWLGKTMRRCEVRVLEGEGHGLMASATVMGGVLMEIAREWEDWVKVTGVNINGKNDGGRRTLRERASVGAFR